MKSPEPDKSVEFERFEALARNLIEVPKHDIKAEMKKDKKKKARAKKTPRPATSQ